MSLMGSAPKRPPHTWSSPVTYIVVRGHWPLRHRLYAICLLCGYKERVR